MTAQSNPTTSRIRPVIEPARLQALRERIEGHAFVPGDDGYDAARQTWNATTFDQHPAIVVMPAEPTDVMVAMTFAREHDMGVAVQGGGHGHPHPADDALLINFKNMGRVAINPQTSTEPATARVEPGARWNSVIDAAHVHGLAPLSGFAGTVGVVGYLLGGGIGWLARQYGAGAGTIRSVELVTADGRLLQVNDRSHSDLLWGLRGGGGNFGVVVSLECALYPIREVFGGQVVYSLPEHRDVLNKYLQWTRTVPDELTSAVRILHFPPVPDIPPALRGASAIAVMACHNGNASESEALLRPMRTLGTPLLDTFARIPFAQVATIANDPADAPPVLTYMDGGAFRDLSSADVATIVGIAGDRASGIVWAEIRHLGGALARQPEGAMPFGLHQAAFYLVVMAAGTTPEQLERGKQSVTAMVGGLRTAMTGELLINALDAGNVGLHLTQAAYSPAAYRRLVALKDQYDPDNVFRFNHNIPPSSSGR
jgi:hypothetical protein